MKGTHLKVAREERGGVRGIMPPKKVGPFFEPGKWRDLRRSGEAVLEPRAQRSGRTFRVGMS